MSTMVTVVDCGEFDAGGRTFKTTVRTYGNLATFQTMVFGKEMSSDTLESLVAKVSQALSRHKIKIDVRFMRYHVTNGGEMVTYHVVGQHGANRNWLIHGDDGSKDQETYLREEFPVLSHEDQLTFIGLQRAAAEANRAVKDFEKAHKTPLEPRVKSAMEAAKGSS